MVGANYFGVALSVNTDSDGSVYVTGFVDEGIDGQEERVWMHSSVNSIAMAQRSGRITWDI